ncbi:hypothetical protein ACKW8C_004448 [Escherichia coli]
MKCELFSTKKQRYVIFPCMKISEGCLILLADNNEVQELRRELYQIKQLVKGMRNGMFSVLDEN